MSIVHRIIFNIGGLPIGCLSLVLRVAMAERNAIKGFICPRCRLLVSASTEMLGEEAVCPGCRSSIRIPSIDQSISSEEPITQAVKLYGSEQDTFCQNWRDDLPKEVLAARTRYLPWAMLLPAFAVGTGLLVSLIVLLFFTNVRPVELNQSSRAVASVENRGQTTIAVVAPTTAEVKELLTQLSQAKTLGETAQWLRNVPDLQKKLANYYKNKEVSVSGPLDVFEVTEFPDKTGFYLFRALFNDRVTRTGTVSKNSSGSWVIDWESYVGYCDVAWDDLPNIQPKTPSLVRAIRVKNEYYNQGFNSNEWQSFKLSYPNSEKILIGYVRRNDSLIHQLLPIGNRFGEMEVTLKIHYPKNVSDPRLVIIDDVIAGDWIVTKKK